MKASAERLKEMKKDIKAMNRLDENGLLSSTDMRVILDRMKYKYKLTPEKFIRE